VSESIRMLASEVLRRLKHVIHVARTRHERVQSTVQELRVVAGVARHGVWTLADA
jgi:hypothetical protein